jgi:alpha-galactosidase
MNVLCNSEVIGINQDLLGKQAWIVRKTKEEFVLAKPLEDGSLAVGLFNLTRDERPVDASWQELKLGGNQKVRDLWRQKDEGAASGSVRRTLPAHGVALMRLSR